MTVPVSPEWVRTGGSEPSFVKSCLYLDQVDLGAVQAWHDAAAAALWPLVRPAGAPPFPEKVSGFTKAPDGTGGPMRPRVWADAMVPELYQAWTVWGYGDEPARGPVDHVRVFASRASTDALHLEFTAGLHEPAALDDTVGAMLEVLRAVGDRTDVAYGELAVNRALRAPYTTLDRALRRTEEESIEQSRRYLRGYEWVTVCPAALVPALGGARALRDSGAFTQVVEPAAGGLLLQATRTPAEYDEQAVRRVFTALRPVLPPGRPRHLQFETLDLLVMEDAAA